MDQAGQSAPWKNNDHRGYYQVMRNSADVTLCVYQRKCFLYGNRHYPMFAIMGVGTIVGLQWGTFGSLPAKNVFYRKRCHCLGEGALTLKLAPLAVGKRYDVNGPHDHFAHFFLTFS